MARASASNRRRGLVAGILLLAAAVGLLIALRPGGDLTESHPPIVLVTIDTLRADRLGAYGSTRNLTPHLDRLAREGIRFDAAVAQSPLTLPSHASMLTGLHPPQHGVRTNDGFRLAPDVPMVQETLRASGYATAAFIGAFPLHRDFGLSRGFDRYDDDFLRVPGAVERPADEVLAATAGWIERGQASGASPFFAWIHLFDPHAPYEPPDPFARRFPDAPYDGEVAYTDAAIGRFLTRLERLDLFDRTVLIVTADHGEGLGDHGERTHGTFVYDSTIRIPLIIRLPNARAAGRVVASPVEAADLAPTVAALAGAPFSDPVDGMNLVPLLRNGAGDPERRAYAETYYQHVLLGWSPLRAIRTARWKFIEAPRPELYDLAADPDETTNLIAQRAATARDLATALPPPVPPGHRPEAATASAGDAGRLLALGYVAGRTVATAASAAVDPKDRVEVWSRIEKGLELLERDPPGAERALREALESDPGNGLVLKYLGDISYRAGRDAEAAGRYRLAVDAGFQHADLFASLAAVTGRLGRTGEARAAIDRALDLEPGSADLWNQAGILRATAMDLPAARDAFRRAMDLAPDRAEPYYNLALVEQRDGRPDAAVEHLRQALERDPAYAEAHVELGNSHLKAGRLEEALAAYERALAVRPEYAEALFSAGRVAAALNRPDEARRRYEQFVGAAPPEYGDQIAIARRELRRLSTSSSTPR